MEVLEPSKRVYKTAVEEARTHKIGVTDALAFLIAREREIEEIYSFDTDFDKLRGLRRVTR